MSAAEIHQLGVTCSCIVGGRTINPELKHLWIPTGVLLGFQVTLLKRRVEREAEVGDKSVGFPGNSDRQLLTAIKLIRINEISRHEAPEEREWSPLVMEVIQLPGIERVKL